MWARVGWATAERTASQSATAGDSRAEPGPCQVAGSPAARRSETRDRPRPRVRVRIAMSRGPMGRSPLLLRNRAPANSVRTCATTSFVTVRSGFSVAPGPCPRSQMRAAGAASRTRISSSGERAERTGVTRMSESPRQRSPNRFVTPATTPGSLRWLVSRVARCRTACRASR